LLHIGVCCKSLAIQVLREAGYTNPGREVTVTVFVVLRVISPFWLLEFCGNFFLEKFNTLVLRDPERLK
jgi:hypothetical protein